jgi:aminoglycoside phosphotransferase family enzyme/predicted kinase
VDIVADLLRAEAYPWRPATVELIETHISWVFLAGDRVLKVKRPVVFPFVDHASLASRRQSCHDEVRLNRRLTDGVYLNVVPIVASPIDNRLEVAGQGPAVEWGTLMRRLPASAMLDALLAAGAAPADLADRLAARLIPFHRDVAARCEGEPAAVAAAMTRIVTDNLAELAPFVGAPLGAVQLGFVSAAMHRFVRERDALLRQRATTGWIREGHGDLRAEHVCLEGDSPVQIFDCVEFNRDVRCADVASDLVYLLMDLTRLGARQTAATLLARYRDAGLALPDDLLRFYGAHRALVRAKIACIGWSAADHEARDALAAESADYLQMATAQALTIRPALVVMTGLSGTGKSTVAVSLARSLDITRIATDEVRKELTGESGLAAGVWREGLYAPDQTEATYDALFTRAGALLAAGQGALLDGTFLDSRPRQHAARLAAARGVPLVLIETVCDDAVAVARLEAREARRESPSDATVDIYRRQRAAVTAAPPVIPDGALHIHIDTTPEGPVDLGPALAAMREAGMLQAVIPNTPWL